MSSNKPVVMVTGASGNLGQLIVRELLARGVPTIAGVRNTEKADGLKAEGAQVRLVDYDRLETLVPAFQGVDRILLISGSDMLNRVLHHQRVIDAAVTARVPLLAYTSLLHADTSPLPIAGDHRTTEEALVASGLNYLIFRNGWYTENFLGAVGPALEHGVVMTCAGDARYSAAPRADFAAGIASVLADEGAASGQILELAGSESFSMAEFTSALASVAGKPVQLMQLSEDGYRDALIQAGIPENFAGIIANIDTQSQSNTLFDEGKTLDRLIGRPTTPLAAVLKNSI